MERSGIVGAHPAVEHDKQGNTRKEELMKKFSGAVVALAASLALVVPAAQAANGNAHFIKNASSATLSGQNLVCRFKEAGLAAGSIETISCSATSTTTYECVNGGGNNPSASNKHTYVTTVSKTGQFTADKNGNVVGTLTLSPPSASSLGFTCPPGQTVTFVGVSYSKVQVVDQTSGASIALPGTYSYTNPSAPAVK